MVRSGVEAQVLVSEDALEVEEIESEVLLRRRGDGMASARGANLVVGIFWVGVLI